MSFACLAKEIKKFAMLISFDFRGHGNSKQPYENLSAENLVFDTTIVLEWVLERFPQSSVIIVGHSMGGSIAAKAT